MQATLVTPAMQSYPMKAIYKLLPPSQVISFWLGLAGVSVWLAWRTKQRKRRLPPGPKGLPILGNLLQLTEDAWMPFTRWANKYGPIVHIKVLGRNIVVLNTLQAATDLLERRSAIYSDRPPNIVSGEIRCGGMLMPLIQYGQRWRNHRKVVHQVLAKPSLVQLQGYQFGEALYLVETLLDNAKSWELQLQRFASSVIVSSLYGLPRIPSSDDPLVHRINTFVVRILKAAAPGAHFVEFLTWMKYLPSWIAPWKRRAQECFKEDSVMFLDLLEMAYKRAAAGAPLTSCSDSIVANDEKYGLPREEYAWILATLYAGGAETTASALAWFILAMVLHTDIQKRAQAELDAVVGRDSPPRFSDIPNLPYIQAVTKEVLRWVPVAPIGVAHALSEDDVYEDYYIPKGTICIANIWAINRDKSHYGPDADSFNPDRYLTTDGKLKSRPLGPDAEGHVSFGFGKRRCVGVHIANNSVCIVVATLLWACNIRPKKDASGRDILPDPLSIGINGLSIHPNSFDVDITPRFADVHSVLDNMRSLGEY